MASNHRRNTSPLREPLFLSPWFAAVPSSVVRWMKNNFGSLVPRRHWLLQCLLTVAIFTIVAGVHAEVAPTSASPATANPAPDQPSATEPAPIPLAEVATDAEEASARLRDMLAESSSDPITEEVAQQLPVLTREIDARLRESRKIVAQRPSLDILIGIEAEWRRLRRNLSGWTRDLTNRATRLEREIAHLDELRKTWEQTLDAAKDANTPPEVVRRIEAVTTQIKQARDAIDKQRARVLTMQSRVAAQDARITDALTSIQQAREDVFDRLFVKDSPPIWNVELHSGAPQEVLEETRNSLSTQWTALWDYAYAERQTLRFLVHAMIFIALTIALYWARGRVRSRLGEDTDSAGTALVFEMPIAAALILCILCSGWIYPQAPRLLWAMLGAAALVPSIIVFRRLLERDLYPTVYALVVLYFLDQVRTVVAAVSFLPRLLFLAEMVGGMLFLVWLVWSMGRRTHSTPETEHLRKIVNAAARAALVVAALAFMGNIIGYVTLANLLGNALLSSAYLALILYAVIEVLDGLVIIALRLDPFRLFSVVRRHGALLRHRMRQGLHWLAIFLWILFVLDRLLLREPLVVAIRGALTAELAVGSLRISLGDVLAFVVTVWVAFLVSRFVRFVLDEDVYPRIHLKRGLMYAISTMLHYVILLIGFFVGIAALGVDMTRVTILAGAFSVGVGFGLQNIFNNFVSGLILLFERPINIGDMVQIDDASGLVEHIGIRASIIRTLNGSEIIVPNGKLISERLTNWTLSNRQRNIELSISVARDADPSRIIALLEHTAAAHPLITDDPPPQALVVSLGSDSLSFELRAWTDRIEQWMQVRSELAIAVNTALATEKIALR
jgi:potassium-dependent mechanosensitive channel